MIINFIIIALILGLGFRLRGDAIFQKFIGRGATTARIITWAIPIGIISWLLGIDPLWAGGMALAAWGGSILGWWDSLDLGRNEGTWLKDFIMHSLRGVIWSAPMAVVLFFAGFNWWWMAGVGILCGILYEIGYAISEKHGTEIGEFLFGSIIGIALVLSFVV